MSFFPVLVNTSGRRVIVAGGGEQAAWKVDRLVQAGVRATVVNTEFRSPFDKWRDHPLITTKHSVVDISDLTPGALVFLADEAREYAEKFRAYSDKSGAWLNVVDKPDWCDFYSMAQIRRGDLVVAVATCGKAPQVAKNLKNFLEPIVDNAWTSIGNRTVHQEV